MQTNLNANHNLAVSITPKIAYIDTKTGAQSITSVVAAITNNGEAISIRAISVFIPPELILKNSFGGIKPENNSLWNFGKSTSGNTQFDATAKRGTAVDMPKDALWNLVLNNVYLTNTLAQTEVEVVVTVKFSDNSTYVTKHIIELKSAIASITEFRVELPTIQPGESTRLIWSCNEISYCEIVPTGERVAASGNKTVRPNESTMYNLYAHGSGFTLFKQVYLEVKNPGVIAFSNKTGMAVVPYASNIVMEWRCNTHTDYAILTNNGGLAPQSKTVTGNEAQNGELNFGQLLKPTTFFLSAGGGAPPNNNLKAGIQASYNINIMDVVADFTANPGPGNVWIKDRVKFTWNIISAVEVSISPALPNGPSLTKLTGSAEVIIERDATYTLTVKGFKDGALTTITKKIELKPNTNIKLNSFKVSPGFFNDINVEWNVNGPVRSITYLLNIAESGSRTIPILTPFPDLNPGFPSRVPVPQVKEYDITLSVGSHQNPNMFSRTLKCKLP